MITHNQASAKNAIYRWAGWNPSTFFKFLSLAFWLLKHFWKFLNFWHVWYFWRIQYFKFKTMQLLGLLTLLIQPISTVEAICNNIRLQLKQPKKLQSKSPKEAIKKVSAEIYKKSNLSSLQINQTQFGHFFLMLATYRYLSRWRLLPRMSHNHPQWDEGSQGETFRCPCTARCPFRRC